MSSKRYNKFAPYYPQNDNNKAKTNEHKNKHQKNKDKNIKFQNVNVWNRDLFKYINKYCMMNKMNGIRRKIENNEYVFDCEEINGKLIILDCFMAFSKIVDTYPFLERLKFASKYIERMNMSDYIVIVPHKINSIKDLFEALNKTDIDNDIDGLVLRNLYDPFQKSRVYKLKSSKLSTIDFLLKDNKLYSWKDGKEILFEFPLLKGSSEYNNLELHTEKYIEQEINDINKLKNEDLNNKIVEMTWDGYSWQPLKVRYDKYRPNKIEFAISNAENIFFPIQLDNVYYKITDIYVNMTDNIISDKITEYIQNDINKEATKDITKESLESFKDIVEFITSDKTIKWKIEGSNGFKLNMYKLFNLC